MESERRERENRRRREEQRRLARRRQARKKEQQGKKATWLWLTMLCLLLVGGLVASAFTFLFPVKRIDVKGNSKYTAQTIVVAAAISDGANLLRVNPQTVENRIRSACPYVTDVKLQRKLPNRVVITVTEGGPKLAFLTGEQYILTTDRYEYIEMAKSGGSATVVYGVAVTPGTAGQPVSFANQQAKSDLDTLLQEITNQSITDITEIDLTNRNGIRLQYKGLHVWKIGDLNNLSYKLTFGQQVSKREANEGTVDLSWLTPDNKDAFFKSGMMEDLKPQQSKPKPPTETVKPDLAIAYEDGFVLLTADLKYIETADETKGGMPIYGVTVTPDDQAKTVTFGYESTKDLLLQILTELKNAKIDSVTAMDLNSSNNIRLQYKQLHVWNLGDPSDMTAKLTFANTVSGQHSEVGEVDLAYMLQGEEAAFTATEQLTDLSEIQTVDTWEEPEQPEEYVEETYE